MPGTDPMIPKCVRHLESAVFLHFTTDGHLLDCNAGLRRLFQAGAPDAPIGTDISGFFINPAFPAVVAMVQTSAPTRPPILFTVGNARAKTWTLKGSIRREGNENVLVAEHDIAELERLNESVLALNIELADVQRSLALANQDLKRKNARIEELSLTDPMTGAANRRRMDTVLVIELTRFARHGAPFSVVMADVDHFKRVNDDYGHTAGDAVLKALVTIMQDSARATDVVARYGGEEFVIVQPHTTADDAVAWAERIRVKVAESLIPPLDRGITASFGVTDSREGDTADTLIARADEALYQAKNAGRNRVVRSSAGTAATA